MVLSCLLNKFRHGSLNYNRHRRANSLRSRELARMPRLRVPI